MMPVLTRLERLLRLRSQEEHEKARQLSQAIIREEEKRLAHEQATANLERCHDQVSGAVQAVKPAGTLENLNRTVSAAAEEASTAEENHRESTDSMDAVQEEFGEARKERRAIERLRDRSRRAADAAEAREEQKEQDDLTLQRWLVRGEP